MCKLSYLGMVRGLKNNYHCDQVERHIFFADCNHVKTYR